MRMLLTAVVLLAGLTSSAFAQSFSSGLGTGNVLQFEYRPIFGKGVTKAYPSAAYAKASDAPNLTMHGRNLGHEGHHRAQ